MQYLIEALDSCSVLRLDGDLASHDEQDLKKMFIELRKEDATHVAADMSKVEFMDSTVIGLFVWGMKNLREVGGDFRLFGLTKPVMGIFEITYLDRAFQIFDTEKEAVGSY